LFAQEYKNSYNRFIYYCIRERKSPEIVKKIEDLFSTLDKHKLFEIAKRNEVASIITANLLELGIRSLPEEFYREYKEVSTKIKGFFYEIDKIAEKFHENGIQIILLKNGGICRALFKDYGKCPMGDIDTLVKKTDFKTAHKLLLESGFNLRFRKSKQDSFEEAFRSGSTEYFKEFNDGTKMWLELSHRVIDGRWISPSSEPDTNLVFSRSIAIENTKARILSPEDNLLQVSLHTAKHSYIRAPGFRLHLDVDRIVTHYDINWKSFVQKVLHYRVKTAVYYSLLIPKTIFATNIPEHVLDVLKPNRVKNTLIKSSLEKAGIMFPDDKKFTNLSFLFFHSLLYDNFGDLFKQIFPEIAWLKERYGFESNFYFPVALLRRFIDLIFRRYW